MLLGRPAFAKQQIIMCKIFFHNNGCGSHGVETDISNNIIIIVVETNQVEVFRGKEFSLIKSGITII